MHGYLLLLTSVVVTGQSILEQCHCESSRKQLWRKSWASAVLVLLVMPALVHMWFVEQI